VNELSVPRGNRYSKSEPELRGSNLLKPSLRAAAYLDCHRRVQLLREQAGKLTPGARILLDIGGRGKPYAPLFEGHIVFHFVLDVEPAESVDLVGDARSLPLADGSVDAVLCTQVLEHVPEPVPVVKEIHRVLRPGGRMILSLPGIFPQHGSPGDYWRYMPQGLAWLLRDFQNVEIRGEAGTVGGFFVTLNMYLHTFAGPLPWLQKLLPWLVYPLTNLAGLAAGGLYRGDQFASNYFVVATR
jgi:Methyltransferase domain